MGRNPARWSGGGTLTELDRPHVYPRLVRRLESLGLETGARLLVALSGGNDSVALLALLIEYRDRRRPDLVVHVGHVHHGIRDDADEDAALARELAARFGLDFHLARVDSPDRAATDHTSVAVAARTLRYREFENWATEHGIDAVLTAHHADDQVETQLENLLRGCGIAGLRGIPFSRPLGTGPARVARPLLDSTRAELENYRCEKGLPHREDATNQDPNHLRVRLRSRLLPQLEREYQPRLREHLRGLGAEAQSVIERIDAELDGWRRAIETGKGFATAPLPPAADDRTISTRAIQHLWTAATGRAGGLNRDVIETAARISNSGGSYDLPSGHRFERLGPWLCLYLEPLGPSSPVSEQRLDGPGGTLAWLPIPWRRRSPEVGNGGAGGLRAKRATPDDRWAVAGGHRPVFEILREAGLPRAARGLYPVIVDDKGVLRSLPGLRNDSTSPVEFIESSDVRPENAAPEATRAAALIEPVVTGRRRN